MGQCLDRWGRFAKYVELNNETDNTDFWRGTPQEYLDHARVIKEEVRKRFPDLPLANAGYTFFLPKSTALFARELKGELQLGEPIIRMERWNMLRQAITMMELTVYAAGWENPQLINTEMGYAAWRLDVERNMAATAIQKLLCCWAHGNQGALLYCSRDIVGPRGTDGDWGYLDYYMCPRFMYGAVGAFVDQYAGARFERIHHETDGLYAYEFKTDAGRLVALFAPNEKEREVVICSDATAVQIVDVMGNSAAAAEANTVTAKIRLLSHRGPAGWGDCSAIREMNRKSHETLDEWLRYRRLASLSCTACLCEWASRKKGEVEPLARRSRASSATRERGSLTEDSSSSKKWTSSIYQQARRT